MQNFIIQVEHKVRIEKEVNCDSIYEAMSLASEMVECADGVSIKTNSGWEEADASAEVTGIFK